MNNQNISNGFDDIELIRERLRNAQSGRKKSGSIASLVEILRNDIEAQRKRGLTWRAIAIAILGEDAKQAAIRSAYQRLPLEALDKATGTAVRKTRTKPAALSPNLEAEGRESSATNFGFTLGIITDTSSLDANK